MALPPRGLPHSVALGHASSSSNSPSPRFGPQYLVNGSREAEPDLAPPVSPCGPWVGHAELSPYLRRRLDDQFLLGDPPGREHGPGTLLFAVWRAPATYETRPIRTYLVGLGVLGRTVSDLETWREPGVRRTRPWDRKINGLHGGCDSTAVGQKPDGRKSKSIDREHNKGRPTSPAPSQRVYFFFSVASFSLMNARMSSAMSSSFSHCSW